MNASSLLDTIPTAVALLLAVVATTALALLALRLMHARMLRRSATDHLAAQAQREWDPESGEPFPAPPSGELAGKVTGLTQAAFVFLVAFTLGSFWGNAQDARTAVQSEAQDLARIVSVSAGLDATSRTSVSAAVEDYRRSVTGEEWAAMRAGDSDAAWAAHTTAAQSLSSTLERLAPTASASPAWSALTSAAEDMAQQGSTRVAQVPGPMAPNVLGLIALLGLLNLVLVTAVLPTRIGENYLLTGLLAAVTALLVFVVLATSNPYAGSAAIHVPGLYG